MRPARFRPSHRNDRYETRPTSEGIFGRVTLSVKGYSPDQLTGYLFDLLEFYGCCTRRDDRVKVNANRGQFRSLNAPLFARVAGGGESWRWEDSLDSVPAWRAIRSLQRSARMFDRLGYDLIDDWRAHR